jgi:hypothetical protein
MESDLNEVKNPNRPVWVKLWIATIIVFSIAFGFFILKQIDGKDVDQTKIIAAYLAFCVGYSAASYFVIRIVIIIFDSIKGKQLTIFFKIIILQLIFLMSAIALYYIASPYQNCIRKPLYEGFCFENTRW